DSSALLFVSMGSLRAATQDLTVMPLVERLRTHLALTPEIGIGVGRTVREAERNADRAADLGEDGESCAGSVTLLGPDEARLQIPHDPSAAAPAPPTPTESREGEILRQLLDALTD